MVWCVCAPALDPSLDVNQYAHRAWRIRESFTKGYIDAMAQTPDGYIWLGTELGLLRFDGVRTVPFQPPGNQHLPTGRISALLVSRDGTLWIGTLNGLASWNHGKLTQYAELAGQSIFSLVEDHEGTLWAGSYAVPSGRLCAIQNDAVHCDGKDGSLGVGVFGLYEDGKGNLWVGVADGLWRWKPGLPEFHAIPGEKENIRGFAESDDGTLLFGTNKGVQQIVDGKIVPFFPGNLLVSGPLQAILRDHDGGLWIGAYRQGIAHVHHGQTDVFAVPDGLSGDLVLHFFEDREGNIWAATADGLDCFRALAVTTISQKQGLLDANPTSVMADKDGSIWLGNIGGLNKWKHGQISTYGKDGKFNGDFPVAMFQDGSGRVWMSTVHGFGYLQNDRFVPVSAVPGGYVRSIAEDKSGNLWIANQQAGLLRLFRDGKVEQVPWGGLGRKDYATALAVDPVRGGLWIGFYEGGISYFADGAIRESYSTANGLGEGLIQDVRLDPDGTVWAATQSGLSRLKSGRIATLSGKNGLPCDAVHWSFEDDDHSFWLYMSCALVQIARPELDAWAAAADKGESAKLTIHPMVFDSSDGARSQAAAGGFFPYVTKASDGKLWFVSYSGFGVIDPHDIAVNKLPPPVQVEEIVADHQLYEATPDSSFRVRLPPLLRDLQIDYTALSFAVPEKVQFRYKLEGWDRDWQDVGTRRLAFYSNLPPRNYTFRVKACNNSGVWNEAGASLNFSIDRAYYQTWWFPSLCVLVFLALLLALYRWRVHQLRRQEKRLRDVVDTIPTMAFVSLPDGYRTFVNKGWVEYTGMTLEQSIGSGWHAALHPDDLKRVLGKWEVALASGQPMYYEARYRCAADGQYRWFMVRVVPQRANGEKRVKYWYGTATDMEDRKRSEELQSQLAHVNRVTILGELSASLSHELKQPIAAAMLSANTTLEWLNRDEPNLERARETTSRILKYGTRATDIIDRLRSLYKKTPLKHELVDVNEVIGEMSILLRGEANRYGVSIRTDFAGDLPKVMADRVQLQQVLMNLMLNGIEAMNETGGVLTVKSRLDEEGRVMISVSDTGVGLPADKADEIFEAFVTTKPQGSGMGLAISRSIVESYCGRLWATANDGRGASFHFTLQTQRTEPIPAVVRSDSVS